MKITIRTCERQSSDRTIVSARELITVSRLVECLESFYADATIWRREEACASVYCRSVCLSVCPVCFTKLPTLSRLYRRLLTSTKDEMVLSGEKGSQ